MNKILILALMPLLAGCLRQTVETQMQACPREGLADVSFSSPAESVTESGSHWTFSGGGKVYMFCRYDDGFTRRQLLPDTISSCSLQRGTDGGISSFSCQAKI